MNTAKQVTIIKTAMKVIAESDVMNGRMDAYLYQTSPTYKEEWERCNIIDLQVRIELDSNQPPNKKLEQDTYYIKLREKLKFEKFRTEFQRKYAKLLQ